MSHAIYLLQRDQQSHGITPQAIAEPMKYLRDSSRRSKFRHI